MKMNIKHGNWDCAGVRKAVCLLWDADFFGARDILSPYVDTYSCDMLGSASHASSLRFCIRASALSC